MMEVALLSRMNTMGRTVRTWGATDINLRSDWGHNVWLNLLCLQTGLRSVLVLYHQIQTHAEIVIMFINQKYISIRQKMWLYLHEYLCCFDGESEQLHTFCSFVTLCLLLLWLDWCGNTDLSAHNLPQNRPTNILCALCEEDLRLGLILTYSLV